MKAIVWTRYGSPDELLLKEVQKPTNRWVFLFKYISLYVSSLYISLCIFIVYLYI